MDFFINMPLAHQILLGVVVVLLVAMATILDQKAQKRRRK